MEVEGFLYDALSPLSPSTAAASPSGHPPPPPVDSEPYAVFRNEISLSAVQPHSPTAAAPDYFSLDLDKDETTIDLTPVRSAAATSVKEPERRLEGGWFRANCRFRSPMVQLHKGIYYVCVCVFCGYSTSHSNSS